MRKIFVFLLCVVTVFCVVSCRRSEKGETHTDTFEGADSIHTNDLQVPDGENIAQGEHLEFMKSVLKNEVPIQSGSNQTLDQWVDVTDASFALVDMDRDGRTEVVVQDLHNVIVLYRQNEQAFAADFTFRSMYNIKKDGTFAWTYTDASGYYHGESRLDIDVDGCSQTELWRIENDGEPNVKYYLLGEAVSKAELEDYWQQHSSEEISFVPLTQDNINEMLSLASYHTK